MAKSDMKVHQYRMDGMISALEIVKRDGVEALEKEIKFRNGKFIPLEMDHEARVKNINDPGKPDREYLQHDDVGNAA